MSSSMPPTSVAEPNSTSQSLASTFTGISLTLKATPAVPMPSFVSWPIVPLTCVPWPSKSSGGLAPLVTKSNGATMRPALAAVDELRRGRIRNRDRAERRIPDAVIVAERGNRRGNRRVLVRHAGVDHRHRDRRAGRGWMSQAFSRFSIGRFHCSVEYSGSLGTSVGVHTVGDLRVLHLRPLAEQSRRSHRRPPTDRCCTTSKSAYDGRAPISAVSLAARTAARRSACRRLVAESHDDAARPVARDGG